jgi:hypothetical protein
VPNRSERQVITPGLLRDWPLPVPDGRKDARGTVLVIGVAPASPPVPSCSPVSPRCARAPASYSLR